MNEREINVNDLRPGMDVFLYGRWSSFDHICEGPRGDSRWICTNATEGRPHPVGVAHRVTHRWSRENVTVRDSVW